MNDIDVIKAAECCFIKKECKDCPLDRGEGNASCIKDLHQAVPDFMKRIKAENERLNSCVKSEDEVRAIMKEQMSPMVREIVDEQVDIAIKLARKEFAERVKQEKIYSLERHEYIIPVSVIDWTLREMENSNDG